MQKNRGFTFIEVIIASAVFLLFAIGAYQGYFAVYVAISVAREKALAADLANSQFEMIKNMPYSTVGTVGGSPSGLLTSVQTVLKDSISFTVTTVVQNTDDPFDGVGGSDPFPADYKLVEIKIECTSCKNFTPMIITGMVAPKNLESA
ncbi:MAG: prepilin-type N-terminal cleavage/methylation domain-containing protein [Candidatus Zambryskibacteria bacterium]|nr:prepilin-type N-terminal cleavage/methylation domain-containing protein [Candidatus Zambryskibacteria bacterium]